MNFFFHCLDISSDIGYICTVPMYHSYYKNLMIVWIFAPLLPITITGMLRIGIHNAAKINPLALFPDFQYLKDM